MNDSAPTLPLNPDLPTSSTPVSERVIGGMAKIKSPIEQAAGKLVSAIQKEWGNELGESTAEVSEEVIERGHNLLQATKSDEVESVLSGLSVTQYLGEAWVRGHPSVKEYIENFEILLKHGEDK